MNRTMVLSAVALGLAGLVWLAAPLHAVLQGEPQLAAAEPAGSMPGNILAPAMAQPVAGATGGKGGVPTAPAFTPAADPLQLQPYDRVLGQKRAPVTIIEYASLTCSHCRDFDQKTFPSVEKEWIATGKARYVLRDLPWDNLALGMAATARCAPAQSFYPLVHALFASQEAIFNAGDKIAAIAQVARMAGMDRARVEGCIRDTGWQGLSNGMKVDGQTKLGIKGTPVLLVNGEQVEGFVEYGDFKKTLDKAYAKTGAAGGK